MMEEVLILAPFGKDAELSATLLNKEGFQTTVLVSIDEVGHDRIHMAGALLLTEEALTSDEYVQLEEKLSGQEKWSDLPIILMISNKDKLIKTEKILSFFSNSGNIFLLERPFRLLTLVTTIKVALRSRRKQYEVKELLGQKEASLKIRDQFLSIASHELKTPITALKLQVQMRKRLLSRGDDSIYSPPKVHSLIETTEHQVERLSRLVDDMLDISRIENGKLSLHYEEVDLGELVSKTFNSLADEFKNANCPVQLNVGKDIKGRWDKHRIEQVVINLFTNAIKYGSQCKVVINVSTVGNEAILSVQDEGVGIAPHDQARVFQRFERADNEDNISGLGLGLFITKEIIEAQGGRIFLESELGTGSTFTVRLPLQLLDKNALKL
jgi:signal transduction histidine kinase